MAGPSDPLFRLRAVVRRTGLKPDLIRAWEVRHGAIAPKRSESNQRLYSEADIKRLSLLRDAVRSGLSISQIAALDNSELELLAESVPAPNGTVDDAPKTALERALEAIRTLDEQSLYAQLREQIVELGRIEFLDRLLVPLMTAVGDAYEDGRLRIVHEHLASATIRSTLEVLRPAFPPESVAPLILVGTPRGQHHELAALLAAASARMEGWRVTYLGANLPAEEFAAAARATGAQAIALSITVAGDTLLAAELSRLRAAPPVDLVVGGRAVEDYRLALDEVGALSVASLAEFRSLLTRLSAACSG